MFESLKQEGITSFVIHEAAKAYCRFNFDCSGTDMVYFRIYINDSIVQFLPCTDILSRELAIIHSEYTYISINHSSFHFHSFSVKSLVLAYIK